MRTNIFLRPPNKGIQVGIENGGVEKNGRERRGLG
jgi:hypothetical protein